MVERRLKDKATIGAIAREFGFDDETARRSILRRLGRRRLITKAAAKSRPVSFYCPAVVVPLLVEQAKRRGTTPGKLAAQILANVLQGDLVAAVLDDGL